MNPRNRLTRIAHLVSAVTIFGLALLVNASPSTAVVARTTGPAAITAGPTGSRINVPLADSGPDIVAEEHWDMHGCEDYYSHDGCAPYPYHETSVQTAGLLKVEFINTDSLVLRVHILVDNKEITVTGYLAPSASSGLLDLGSVAPGRHMLEFDEEPQDHNPQTEDWDGTVRIHTSTAPDWLDPTPPDKTIFYVPLGSSRSFTVKARAQNIHYTVEEQPNPLSPPTAAGMTCIETQASGPDNYMQMDCTIAPTKPFFTRFTIAARNTTGGALAQRTYSAWSGRYVALGDSYASGQGNEPFDPDSIQNGAMCNRSKVAYPRVLTSDPEFHSAFPQQVDHVACSGATTDDVEKSQLPHLGSDVELVTLTVGGDNIDFPKIAHDCVQIGPSFGHPSYCSDQPYEKDFEQRLKVLESKLDGSNGLYEQIRSKLPPSARILVLGYPRFFREPTTGAVESVLDKDQAWANGIIAELDDTIRRVAWKHGLEFVDVYGGFQGHELGADNEWWLNGIDKIQQNYSFHPRPAGHKEFARLILQQLSEEPYQNVDKILQGQTILSQAVVNLGQALVSFFLRWPGSEVEMSLISPTGRIINRSVQAADVEHLIGPTYEAYTISNPEPGKWSVRLFGAKVAQEGEPVTLQMHQATVSNIHSFPETGYSMRGTFWTYWQGHGGLAQQGYPISDELTELSDLNDKPYTVQYTERAVFEHHPEYAGSPYEVELAQLGTFRYQQKYPHGAPGQKPNQTPGNSHYFPETKHWIGGAFWQYWQSHGGLAQQGYPLSDEFTEVSDLNHKPYTVQYFERAVFEFHPENAGSPYLVLLAQLGTFRYKAKYQPPAPAPTPTPCPIQFSDVPPDNPSYADVRCLACQGIINGYGDGTFHPVAPVTRAQMSKIIASAVGYNDNIPAGRQTFTDVPRSNPFWLYIERMVAHNAISGYACGGPGEPCPGLYLRPSASFTRGQTIKSIAIAAGYTENIPPGKQTYRDVPKSNLYWLFVERASLHGVISGYPCGGLSEPCPGVYLRPNNNVTRVQTAELIGKAFFPDCQTR